MNVHAEFNEDARGALRKATALSRRLVAESRQIQAECDACVLDTLIAMFRSDALICASKIEQRRRNLDEMPR
jgi:hypothetical protein